ncbi:MAG: 23S rRNA (adenine(2503)-C(2))-methyltransferase RlmN [Candidatus Margulisiibacteriota bacterium]
MNRYYLAGLTKKELEEALIENGFKKFRADQLIKWVFEKNVFDIAEMSDIAKSDQEKLAKIFSVLTITPKEVQISKIDKTQKVLFEAEDHETFESVLLNDKGRYTLCISSQIGCKMGCKFCATGADGFVRNMPVAEIVSQFLYFNQKKKIDNIVFMGMGEPLDNYKNVVKAIKILSDNAGFAQRRITVSTVGLVPDIKKLADEKLKINLAVSLNAVNDNSRKGLMPATRKYNLEELIESLRYYFDKTSRRVTIEYVLLEGINDSERDAKDLVWLLKGMACNINLIQYNSVDTLNFSSPVNSHMSQFKHWLERDGKEVTIRFKRGRDIDAACGQLRRR